MNIEKRENPLSKSDLMRQNSRNNINPDERNMVASLVKIMEMVIVLFERQGNV